MQKNWFVGVCLVICGSHPALAEQVTFEVHATVYEIYDPGNVLQGSVSLGNSISGTYTFDTSVQDSDPSPEYGLFDQTNGNASGFDIQINQENIRSDRSNSAFMYEIYVENHFSDNFRVASWGNTPLQNGALVNDILLDLYDQSGTALNSTDLAVTAPDVNAFINKDMIIVGSNNTNTQNYHIAAKVDSITTSDPGNTDPNIAVFNLDATVRDVWDPAGALNNTVNVGDSLQGNYSVNLLTPDNDASPEFGKYIHTPGSGQYGFDLTVGGHNVQTNTSAVEFTVELYNGVPAPDHYSIYSYGPNDPLSTGASVEDIGMHIYDDTGNMLSSTQLTNTAPILPSGGVNEVHIWGFHPNGMDTYHIVADIQAISAGSGDAPSLVAVSPGTGVFDRSQQFDMAIIFQPNLPWIMDMFVNINGMDETPSLYNCGAGMPNSQNRQTFVCPGYSNLPMFRNGTNTLDFRFILEDGSVLIESVEWEMLGN